MRIAILGGTGALGEGLAMRIARDTDHEVVIGSRNTDRAVDAAARYADRAGTAIDGSGNRTAAADAELVVLSVPAKYARGTLEDVSGELWDGVTIVSPAVPMASEGSHFSHNPPRTAPSLTALLQRIAPDGAAVVGAYHAVPAPRLADLDDALGYDVPVVGNDGDAKRTVIELTDALAGLRGLDAGPLEGAALVESLTPLLVTLSRHNEASELGPEFH